MVPGVEVLRGELPPGAVTGDVGDARPVADLDALGGDGVDVLAGEGAVVDVGALLRPADRHGGREVPALGHEREVLGERLLAVAELHAGEQRVGAQCLVAGPEVVDLLHAAPEGHVGDRVDELGGVAEAAVLDEVAPELAGDLELLVDADGLGDVDLAVDLGRVVELAEGGVAGARVVPRGGGLRTRGVEGLDDELTPLRLELLQHDGQCGGDDAGTDQSHVDVVCGLRG